MEPVQHVVGRTDARGLAKGARSVGTVAQDGDRRRRCRTQVVQHAAQLLCLVVGLGRHAGEDDVLAVVVAGLRDDRYVSTTLIQPGSEFKLGFSGSPRVADGSCCGSEEIRLWKCGQLKRVDYNSTGAAAIKRNVPLVNQRRFLPARL